MWLRTGSVGVAACPSTRLHGVAIHHFDRHAKLLQSAPSVNWPHTVHQSRWNFRGAGCVLQSLSAVIPCQQLKQLQHSNYRAVHLLVLHDFVSSLVLPAHTRARHWLLSTLSMQIDWISVYCPRVISSLHIFPVSQLPSNNYSSAHISPGVGYKKAAGMSAMHCEASYWLFRRPPSRPFVNQLYSAARSTVDAAHS